MQGFINEDHMEAAEAMFPGIRRLYLELVCKPTTFLELLWEYHAHLARCGSNGSKRGQRPSRARGRQRR